MSDFFHDPYAGHGPKRFESAGEPEIKRRDAAEDSVAGPPGGETEDTAAELIGWLAENGVHLADGRGEIPYQHARSMIQRFLDGARRRAPAWPGGISPKLELARHKERPYE